MIINLTQHPATPEQVSAGVVDLPPPQREVLLRLLTCSLEDFAAGIDIVKRAERVAQLAKHNGLGGDNAFDPACDYAMIGGSPWVTGAIEGELQLRGIIPLFSFADPSGKHCGFIPASTISRRVTIIQRVT